MISPQFDLRLLLLAALLIPVPSLGAESVKIPWKGDFPHNSDRVWSKDYDLGWSKNFMNGTPQENGVVKRDGYLTAEVFKPKGKAPFPFIVMLHGCAGMNAGARRWIAEYAALFNGLGYGVLAPDSFTTRNVKESCGKPDGHWARRRSEDAYSALAFLLESRLSAPDDVILMGRSNGGNATLMALEDGPMSRGHSTLHFAGGIALIPPCRGKKDADFYAPLMVFVGGSDDANDPEQCILLGQKLRPGKPSVKVIVYAGANHGYMDREPSHVFHGWTLSYNALAAEDTKRLIEMVVMNRMSGFSHGVEQRP